MSESSPSPSASSEQSEYVSASESEHSEYVPSSGAATPESQDDREYTPSSDGIIVEDISDTGSSQGPDSPAVSTEPTDAFGFEIDDEMRQAAYILLSFIDNMDDEEDDPPAPPPTQVAIPPSAASSHSTNSNSTQKSEFTQANDDGKNDTQAPNLDPSEDDENDAQASNSDRRS